jgi:hypothetical protein
MKNHPTTLERGSNPLLLFDFFHSTIFRRGGVFRKSAISVTEAMIKAMNAAVVWMYAGASANLANPALC